ncbi:L,D-transpeptidase-like protein [Pseudonocardia sediminis]|uniref:L,D-transpeptidase-like protein n=1 Tax=Pseudonocardia sediminis TaxID=1397368 RepID=A0A4Q7UQK2_PSEST|nr:L,D-transpeptidase [Pseudonocardia sediminis]RZT83915.1 L,D-transpeptidase-like protein [Pseudonocardia sediminis]
MFGNLTGRWSRAIVVGALVAVSGLVVTGVASAKPAPASSAPGVAGTPCTAEARACVDRAAKKAWLITDGKVSLGPLPASTGGPGHETPPGDFTVEWKHQDHRSAEFNNAPMPWAVFFAQGGIAFHEGNVHTPSAGCVRLEAGPAKTFYETLQVGSRVEIRG